MTNKNMEAEIYVQFDESTSRQSLDSGDSITTLFGKVKKWLSDLKSVAFSGSYNDLSDKPTTATIKTEGFMSAEDKSKLDSVGSTYALKSKYGDTAINVGRKAGTTVGAYSTAEGVNTTASGMTSHAEGETTTANGKTSHAEGNFTVASGDVSHAEGHFTVASGEASHAEGYSNYNVTKLIENFSSSTSTDDIINAWKNKKFTLAHENFSHAEGWNCLAFSGSHAEGKETIAKGACSHTEGDGTIANGRCSHAEGYCTIADGEFSHAGGRSTKALYPNEVAYGKYNESNVDTLFSIGDGTAEDSRHNAFEITRTGGKLHDKRIATADDIPTSLPANGGNADTVNNHTVNSDVPTNAVFTDTWRGIQDNLTSDSAVDSLSANQGKVLNGKVEQNKTDISQLFDITKGGEIVSGNSSYTLANTVDYPLIGLSLYGKSTQNGTPTPENPVDIVSVGDSGFDIITKNEKHFNLLSVRDNGGEIITKQPVSAVGKNGETKQFIVSATGSGLTYQWWQNVNNGMGWVIIDVAGARQPIFSVPVAAFRNGYKFRCVVADGNGNSETSNEVTLYVVSDECEITTASIATNIIPLCGIPVSSGGNYTDSSGQQWICDELIYNADGTGKLKKYTNDIIFNGSEDWKLSGNGKRVYISIEENLRPAFKTPTAKALLFSNKYIAGSYNDTNNATKTCISTSLDLNFHIYDERFIGDVNGLKADMAAENLRVVYALATPYEIELTATEMTAFRQLQTFNGTTSISNDAGAEMSVKYCTNKALSEFVYPVTMGLQKQIEELKSAILSMGGNV